MSVERYKMLTTSTYVQITKATSKRRILLFIFVSWSLPLITWIPYIIKFNESQHATTCELIVSNGYIVLILSIVIYYVPLSAMISVYTMLICHIRRTSDSTGLFMIQSSLKVGRRQIKDHTCSMMIPLYQLGTSTIKATRRLSKQQDQANKRSTAVDPYNNTNYNRLRLKRNQRAAKMLGLLIVCFTVCWLPFIVTFPITQFYANVVPNSVNLLVWWLGYINSALNPFLYFFANRSIRSSVRTMFVRRFRILLFKCRRHDSDVANDQGFAKKQSNCLLRRQACTHW
jgi:hypothetical protein